MVERLREGVPERYGVLQFILANERANFASDQLNLFVRMPTEKKYELILKFELTISNNKCPTKRNLILRHCIVWTYLLGSLIRFIEISNKIVKIRSCIASITVAHVKGKRKIVIGCSLYEVYVQMWAYILQKVKKKHYFCYLY